MTSGSFDGSVAAAGVFGTTGSVNSANISFAVARTVPTQFLRFRYLATCALAHFGPDNETPGLSQTERNRYALTKCLMQLRENAVRQRQRTLLFM